MGRAERRLYTADSKQMFEVTRLNAVWFAEEFNEHCPKSPMEIPVTEVELRELLVLPDGGNFADEVAHNPITPDMNLRDHMKDKEYQAFMGAP